jgi:hypothetical protein
MALVQPCFEGWRKHAAKHVRRGLNNLDSKTFISSFALVLTMGLLGLLRRDHHFTPEVRSTAMSQTTFEMGFLGTKRENVFQTDDLLW